jgi:hypothetical protein
MPMTMSLGVMFLGMMSPVTAIRQVIGLDETTV